jgi:hypothetical protein
MLNSPGNKRKVCAF